MTTAPEHEVLEDWFVRRRHPGSGAALASLVLAAAWLGLALLPDEPGLVPESVALTLWFGLLPLSGFVSLWSLAADRDRGPWRWVVVVVARAWAVVLSSAFVLLVRLGATRVQDPTSDAEIARVERPAWMLWTEWGVIAGIILLVGLATGLTVKRLPLHSPRHRTSRSGDA